MVDPRSWALVVALLGACADAGAARPSEPMDEFVAPSERCDRDDECTVTDFPGCCECCGCAVAYPTRRDALEQERASCGSTECDAGECAVVECAGCPPPPPAAGACRNGRCVLP